MYSRTEPYMIVITNNMDYCMLQLRMNVNLILVEMVETALMIGMATIVNVGMISQASTVREVIFL